MSGLHRIFVAVELQPALHQAVVDAQRKLEAAGAHLKWIRPANLHFTLRFIGEVPEAQVALAKIATREAATGVGPFTVVLGGLGAFPSLRRPEVIWIGVTDGGESLMALAARVEDRLAHHRFPPDARRFRPHLTLARVRDTRQWGDLVRALTQHADLEAGSQEVRSVAVLESQLSPAGAVYTRVEEVSLLPHEK